MSAESNEPVRVQETATPAAVHRRFFDAYDKQDLAAVHGLLTEDFVAHFGTQDLDREAYTQFVSGFYAGFPDLGNRLEQQVAQGDLVASRTIWTGTHRGAFLGVEATGRTIVFEALSLSRISRGRIAEHWFIGDLLGVLQQLGASHGAQQDAQ